MWVKLLTKIKEQRGWSGYKMAAELGINQTQLNHYERNPPGQREINLVRLQEISGMTVPEFWEALKEEVAEVERQIINKKVAKLKQRGGE